MGWWPTGFGVKKNVRNAFTKASKVSKLKISWAGGYIPEKVIRDNLRFLKRGNNQTL